MPEIIWRCSTCKKEFASEEQANLCEVAHSLVSKIVVVDALFDLEKTYYSSSVFPNRITIRFSDKHDDQADYSYQDRRIKSVK